MTVPITSDLAGYALFWDRMIWRLIVSLALISLPIDVLLFMLWRK